ncbi:hypothetical protein CYMTET_40506 [Cymbomonas tetramitiformis]|uniref:RING-type domain-containing protein n=1 Tax=Cymbomonas tetramitiformis TaxID=36881 RepID=A0AAE0F3K5_9CHLO|nr:hypothetical protein CYMTET_40506 [Cymbomonas tetramitiformis]
MNHVRAVLGARFAGRSATGGAPPPPSTPATFQPPPDEEMVTGGFRRQRMSSDSGRRRELEKFAARCVEELCASPEMATVIQEAIDSHVLPAQATIQELRMELSDSAISLGLPRRPEGLRSPAHRGPISPANASSQEPQHAAAGKAAAHALRGRLAEARQAPQQTLLDLKTWESSSPYKPIPELSGKVSQALAKSELQERAEEITNTIMARAHCAVCWEHVGEDEKLFRVCELQVPVQHLMCERCLDRDRTHGCPMCKRPRVRTEQCEAMRRNFYRIKCQSCPLCTDPTKRTAEELLKHVDTECAAVESETITVDVRKLQRELEKFAARCVEELCASPETATVIQEAIDSHVLLAQDTIQELRMELSDSAISLDLVRHMSTSEIETLNQRVAQLEALKHQVKLDDIQRLKNDKLHLVNEKGDLASALEKMGGTLKRCEQANDDLRKDLARVRDERDRWQREAADTKLSVQRRAGSHAEHWGRPKRPRRECSP